MDSSLKRNRSIDTGEGLGPYAPMVRQSRPRPAESAEDLFTLPQKDEPEPEIRATVSPNKASLLELAKRRWGMIKNRHQKLAALFPRHDKNIQTGMNRLLELINTYSNKIENFKTSDSEEFDGDRELTAISAQLTRLTGTINLTSFHPSSQSRIDQYVRTILAACEPTWEGDPQVTASDKNEQLLQQIKNLGPVISAINDKDLTVFHQQLINRFPTIEDAVAREEQLEYLSQLLTEVRPTKSGAGQSAAVYSRLYLVDIASIHIGLMSKEFIKNQPLIGNDVLSLLEALARHMEFSGLPSENQTIIKDLQAGLTDEALGPQQWKYLLNGLDQLLKNNGSDTSPLAEQIRHFQSWCQSQSVELQADWGPTSMQDREDFCTLFSVINTALQGLDDELDQQLDSLMTKLQAKATKAPHQEWAEISVAMESLEKLAAQKITVVELDGTCDQEKTAPIRVTGLSAVHGGLKLSFIQKNLSGLVVTSNQRWAEHAKSVITSRLSNYYDNIVDLAYQENKSTKISAETNFLPVFVGANIRSTYTEATDMEGNFFRKTVGTVGATVGMDVGLNFLKTMGISLFKPTADVSGGGGKLEEYSKIKKMVLNEFDALLKIHAGDVSLIPFSCRHSALGTSEHHPDDQITVRNITQIRQHYQSDYQRINRNFELLRSLTSPNSPPLPQLHSAELEDASPLLATMTILDGDATASVGPKIEAMGHQLAGINAFASGNINRSTVSFERHTPVVEKLMAFERLPTSQPNPPEDALYNPVNNDEEPQPLESDGEELVDLADLSQKETTTGIIDTGLFSEKNIGARQNLLSQKKQIITEVSRRSEQFLNLLKSDYEHYKIEIKSSQTDFLTSLWTYLESIFSPANEKPVPTPKPVVAPREGGNQAEPGVPPDHVGTAFAQNQSNWEYNFERLSKEFEYYSTLQSRLVQGATGAKQSIQQFHTYYHANSPEDCLYHMQLLNMNAAINLFKLENVYAPLSAAESDIIARLKAKVLQFEKVLNQPDFDIDQKKLAALTSFKEDVTVVSTSAKLSGGVDIGLGPKDTQSLFRAQRAGSVEFSHKAITVPLRRGWFRDYQYSTGWLAQLGSTDAVMKFFFALLGRHAAGMGDLPGLQEEIGNYYAGSFGIGRDITTTRRVFMPDLFPGIDATWLYTIGTKVKKSVASIRIPAPLVTAGVDQVRSSSRLKILTCSPHTTLYFLMLYHHDYSSDKNTVYDGQGKDGDQTNWKAIKTTQRNALEGLFHNVAVRNHSDAQAQKLNNELQVIHQRILKSLSSNPEYQHSIDEATAALERSQQKFFEASEAFDTALPQNKEDAYNRVLDCFQRLMFAYCPHLNRMKATSDLAVPRKLSLKRVT